MYFTFGHKLSIKILFVTKTIKFTRLIKSALTFTSAALHIPNKSFIVHQSFPDYLHMRAEKEKSPSVFIDTNNNGGVKIESDY